VLERGRMVKHIEDYPTMHMDPWDMRNGETSSPEFVSIAGESGSGKSITTLTLIGLHPKNVLLNSDKMEFNKKQI